MGNIYTLSLIRQGGEIHRLHYDNRTDAEKKYTEARGLCDKKAIMGVQLWQCRQGKTIDTDPLARIIKQYYI